MADEFDMDPVKVRICLVRFQEEYESDPTLAQWPEVDGWPFEIEDCPYHWAVTESVTTSGYVATNLETGGKASHVQETAREAAWEAMDNWKRLKDKWIPYIEKHKQQASHDRR